MPIDLPPLCRSTRLFPEAKIVLRIFSLSGNGPTPLDSFRFDCTSCGPTAAFPLVLPLVLPLVFSLQFFLAETPQNKRDGCHAWGLRRPSP